MLFTSNESYCKGDPYSNLGIATSGFNWIFVRTDCSIGPKMRFYKIVY